MSKKAVINKIIPMSVVDGPGNRTAIFFQGCNLNCIYCHNPETISHIPTEESKEYTVQELIEEIKENIPFIKGITTSGGECTLNYKFLEELFKETKKLGLTNFVDTNGYLPLDNPKMKKFIEYTDGFMLDIKSMDEKEHIELTGKPLDNIVKNAIYLAKIGKLKEIRTVLIDGKKNKYTVETITELLKPYSNINYKLISYRPFGVRKEFLNLKSVSEKEKKELEKIVISKGMKEISC